MTEDLKHATAMFPHARMAIAGTVRGSEDEAAVRDNVMQGAQNALLQTGGCKTLHQVLLLYVIRFWRA